MSQILETIQRIRRTEFDTYEAAHQAAIALKALDPQDYEEEAERDAAFHHVGYALRALKPPQQIRDQG